MLFRSRGLRPVVEIMFGDFTTLIADQVINHLSKFQSMYPGVSSVPVVIRTPMGGRRGYGPTHSQTLEKLYLGVPGLTVLAPFHLLGQSALGSPGDLLAEAILNQNSPTMVIENKLQYLLKLMTAVDLAEFDLIVRRLDDAVRSPCYQIAVKGAPPPQITLTAYGYMAHLALEAVRSLAYDLEIFCELIVPTRLAPFDLATLIESVRQTGRLLTVEEGTFSMGWGAEALARSSEALGAQLRQASRLAGAEGVIPVAPELEARCLPSVDAIIDRVRKMVAA